MRPVMSRLMPTCAKVTHLVSIGMDEDLTLRNRMKVRLHLLMCKWCSMFEKQVRLVRKLARENAFLAASPNAEGSAQLNPAAKAKLQDAIGHELG